jgi:serine/threonine-protein kinase HipA
MNRLHIFRDTTKIAELIRLRGGRLELSYVDGLELSSPLVSVNLPTQPKPYRGDNVAAFFNGLLPEGEARRIIGYDLGIDANDIFEMLRAIGAECAGALSITPEDPPPRQRPPDQTNPILTDGHAPRRPSHRRIS